MKVTVSLPSGSSPSPAVNLRPANGGGLQPVGHPAVVSATPSARAVALGVDGGHLCIAADLLSLRVVPDSGAPYDLGSLPARYCGITPPVADGSHWIFTDAGPVLLTRSASTGRYSLGGPLPGFGAVTIRAEDSADYSAVALLPSLTGRYPRGAGNFTAEDSLAVGEVMTAAYRSVVATAAANGARVQPSFVAWQLRDSSGQIIFRSSPQWLSASGGFQMAEAMHTTVGAEVDGGRPLGGLSVSATSWRAVLSVDSSAVDPFWATRCASLEIIAAPQMHFTSLAESSQGRIADGAATLFMPGAARGLATDFASLRSMAIAALGRFRSEAVVVATVPYPFVNPAGVSGPIALASDGHRAYTAGSTLPVALDFPNRWSATESVSSGVAAFHGGIVAIPAGAMLPGELAAAALGSAVIQSSVLTLADGSSVTRAGTSFSPLSLPPVIVVAQPDAVSLALSVGADTSMTLPLQPSPDGAYACWVAPSLAASDFSELSGSPDGSEPGASDPSPPSNTVSSLSSLLLCARSDSPLEPVSATAVCGGTIRRITPPAGASGGWNYGRLHMVVWASDGVYALSADRSMLTVASSLIHSPGVTRPDAVAVTHEAAYAALASGTLVRMSGSRASPVEIPVKAVAVGWDQTRGGLWVQPPDPAAGPVVLTDSGGVYRRTLPVVDCFCPDRLGRLHMLDSDGHLLRASAPEVDVPLPVEWTASVAADIHPSAMTTWLLYATAADLSLEIGAGFGPVEQSFCSLRLRGDVNAPVIARVYSPPSPLLRLRIAGNVSPPALLREVQLKNM